MLNGKKTTYIFKHLQEVLQSVEFKETYRCSAKDFTRHRVLGFADMILLQINRLVLSVGIELEIYLDRLGSITSFSKQAFSQGRQKIKHEAFIALNQQLVEDYYAQPTYKRYQEKYILVAVDGSLCQLPESEELAKAFDRWKNHKGSGMIMARSSVMYDVLNELVIDSVFQTCLKQDKSLFSVHQTHLKSIGLKDPILYLLDRGYQGYDLLQEIKTREDFFLMRCTAGYCNEVKAFVEKQIEEDILWLSPKGKALKNAQDKGLKVRIVQILLSSGEYEYLLTNTTFDREELSILYFKRWGVETFYGFIKGNMQLENFSAKTKEGILQDFFACMLTANLASLLIADAQEELDEQQAQKSNKYSYKINKNLAVGIFRNNLIALLLKPQHFQQRLASLKKRIKRYKVPIIPERSFVRNKQKRTRRKFHLCKKRAF